MTNLRKVCYNGQKSYEGRFWVMDRSESKIKLLKLLDAIFSAIVLLLALRLMVSTSSQDPTVFGVLLFLTMAIGQAFTTLTYGLKQKSVFAKNVVVTATYVACAVFYAVASTDLAIKVTGTIVYLAIIANRAFSIVIDKSRRNVILNALFIPLVAFFALSVMVAQDENVWIGNAMTNFLVMLRALGHIIANAFSRIRLGVLRKIIRKTYASEILFGMLSLMFAFSMVFVYMEPSNFSDFGDALWYCFAVVTTIGFGDIATTTTIGRILTTILGLYGLIVVALLTSIIVNFYMETKNDEPSEKDDEPQQTTEKHSDEQPPSSQTPEETER